MLFRILFGIALAASTTFILKMVLYMGFHKTLWNHRPGKCHIVEGIDYGSEDMQTTKSGLTFITSGVNGGFFSQSYKEYYEKHKVRGRIMLFNMEKPEEGVKELTIIGNKFSYDDFYPHGISVLEDKGKVLLFVVVHRKEQDTVEKFEFLEKTLELKYLKTHTGTLAHVLNDVVATGPETFYATDYFYYRDSRHVLEALFGLHFGHILYYNGSDFTIASEPTYLANGFGLSKNGKFLYVVSSGGQKVMIFKRESNNRLTKVNEIPVDTVPDNLVVDSKTGDLLLGCHPIVFKTVNHLDNPVEPAASQVLMLHMDSNGTNLTGITELFSDDLELYGSTVATLYKNRMLIGTILHKMMYCEVNIL